MIGVASVTTLAKNKILEELKDKESRDIFVSEHVSTGLPFQIHALREKLGITQAELARRAKMAQERISVLENPNSEFIPKINTLLKLANVFDVPLIVKFGTWEELFEWETNLSPELLAPENFDEALESLEQVASGSTAVQSVHVSSTSTPEWGWTIYRDIRATYMSPPFDMFFGSSTPNLKNKDGEAKESSESAPDKEESAEGDSLFDLFTSGESREIPLPNVAANILVASDRVM